MPGAYHGLCTWHLMQNGIKHLGNLMKGESYFLTDFKKCMYGYEDEEQFEDGWTSLLKKYGVQKNDWLQRMYNIKEKWASCYMKKTLTLGMRSTQLSESVNADIKNFMSKDLDLIKFFERFEDVVEEKRYKELKCEFEACFVKSMDIQTSSSTYVIAKKRNMGEWQVTFDLEKNTICCSCRKFESFGILCCHCLKVFIHMDVTSVPEPYILKRWTKIARSRA
jgi:zinc finger SWIM domain-containing protein 3